MTSEIPEPVFSRGRFLPRLRYRWIETPPPRPRRGYSWIRLWRTIELKRRIVWPWQPIGCFDLTKKQAFGRPIRSSWPDGPRDVVPMTTEAKLPAA